MVLKREKKQTVCNKKHVYSEEARRHQIIALFKAGKSRIEIARTLPAVYSTVKRVVSRYLKCGTVVRKEGSGRQKHLSKLDQLFLKENLMNDSSLSLPELARLLQEKTGKVVCLNAIYCALRRMNYSLRDTSSMPLLTPKLRIKRMRLVME
ncbi:hypothetical protein NEPAR05_2264 [Nematocida parisii]|nr:hypothetical protein NEPAR05_0497 [Nematocida parisii]KAI5157979.1 hypothetical protein NEPAR05_1756 [Nematocida parisii]KAI5158005.1 hypothetical protein NEPAR05_1782 [Nematocida parisii]KAI5158917.1 hypothetical protein NEPAR05_2264 [Nematocida parisii]